MGILIGAYGPRFHMVTYTTNSSNLMLRSLGLSIYLACLGLDAGADFLATVMRPAALIWIAVAMVITLLPVIIMGAVSVLFSKQSFSATCGMVCGAMANPIALNYANDTLPGDEASVSYATVYPLHVCPRHPGPTHRHVLCLTGNARSCRADKMMNICVYSYT